MDIEQIKTLVELMVANDISRIELHDGDSKILLRRGQPAAYGSIPFGPPPVYPQMPFPASGIGVSASGPANQAPAPGASAQAGGGSPAVPETNEIFVKSPMVGTFYASPDPDSPAFVAPGSSIGPESVVCIIEAMKVFNEIKAEVSGRITRVLVKNAQAVEFDQPLFAVSPS